MGTSSYSMEGEDVILASLFRNADKGNFSILEAANHLEFKHLLFIKKATRLPSMAGTFPSNGRKPDPGDRFVRSLLGDSNGGVMDYWMFPDPTMNTVDVDTALRYASRFPSTDVKQVSVPIQRAYDVYQANCVGKAGSEVSPPHLVSIDVEGFEISVLSGLLSQILSGVPQDWLLRLSYLIF